MLLSREKPDHWSSLFSSLTTSLTHVVSLVYAPVLGPPDSFPSSSPLNLQPPPDEEPMRTSLLVRQLLCLSLALSSAVSFPPPTTVDFPLQPFLSVVFFGLSVYPQDVASHSPEALLLLGVLPCIHSAMWTLLTVAIQR